MKRTLSAMSIVMAIVLLTCMASPATAAKSRITLLNPPKGGVLELEVGESYTFNIEIASGPSFTLAMAMPDAYYPGRAIAWHGNDIAHGGNSAVLQLTMTGKGSTADFEAVCDWPEPGTCWPDGVVPASIVVGVRSSQGEVLSERFDFAVVVP